MASNYAKMCVSLYLWIVCLCVISSQIGAYDDRDKCPTKLPRNRFLRTSGRKCYQFVRTEMYWEDARNFCRRKGGDLITITSRQIQGMVERAMYDLWSNNGMWMGATDRHDEMNWKWVTGERIGYNNWDSSQPSCFLLDFMCHEDCGVVRKDKRYKWHDYACKAAPYTYGFACQYDMIRLPTTQKAITYPTTTAKTTTTRPTTTTAKAIPVKTSIHKMPNLLTEKTSKKVLTSTKQPVQVTNASISIMMNPENLVNVESQRISSEKEGIQTGGVVGLVMSFLIVFLAGLIIGVVMCRRRYRRKYSEEVAGGFNNVLYTAAPRQPTSDRVKETNVMLAAAAIGREEDDYENAYSSIDEVQACAKNVNLPTAKEIEDCKSNQQQQQQQHVENLYETVPSDFPEVGGASEDDPPPPPPHNFPGFRPDFLKKDTDVSEAYSNNLYGYTG